MGCGLSRLPCRLPHDGDAARYRIVGQLAGQLGGFRRGWLLGDLGHEVVSHFDRQGEVMNWEIYAFLAAIAAGIWVIAERINRVGLQLEATHKLLQRRYEPEDAE